MRKGSHLYNVIIGAFDKTEVCQLVDASLLHQVPQRSDKKDVDIYRDDRL